MKQFLSSKELDAQLNQKGFVVVPFLQTDEVEELKTFFKDNHQDEIPSFYATAHSTNVDFRKKMNEKIREVFDNSIENYFQNCIPLGGSFIVKNNKGSQILNAHQDWNIVDESQFRSFNIWVPLLDLTSQNGAIAVIPESHLWVSNFRGPNIPNDFQEYSSQLWKMLETLEMKAGEALIYDHRLFHASHANNSNELRLACVFGIIPDEAEMYYFFGNENQIEQYESNVEFFMNGNIQQGNEILKKIKSFERPKLDLSHLPFQIEKQEKISFFKRWFS